jgi:LysM repeat protein
MIEAFDLEIEVPGRALLVLPLPGEKVKIGRLASNHIEVDDALISDEHCEVSREGNRWWIVDLHSTNGTFVAGTKIAQKVPLEIGQRFDIGTTQCRIVARKSSAPVKDATGARPRPGSTIRSDEGLSAWMVKRDRYLRWANEWHSQGRSTKHLAKATEVQRIAIWRSEAARLETTVDEAIESWLHASRQHARIVRRATWGGALMLCAAVAFVAQWQSQKGSDAETSPPTAETTRPPVDDHFAAEELFLPDEDAGSLPPNPVKRDWIMHPLAPGEKLDDVAARYEVSPALIAQWNDLNVDHPDLKAGGELKIIPRRPMLPPQRIEYEVETGEDFQTLALRFGIPLDKLALYNPDVKKVKPGQTIVIWVDPAPLGLKPKAKVFERQAVAVQEGGISHGLPQQGWIENSVQIPPSPLYKRRNPVEMYTSSHMLANLTDAVVYFRKQYEWEGTLVLADASLKDGGPIRPHKSHQSGRDIDIWLPSIRGVYKDSHLDVDRRPNPNEADWFVTWYLIESLLETGEIRHIFLSYDIQESLYTAAKISGKTDEELASIIQWPNGNTNATVRHADGHIHHIHVRFKCPKGSTTCRDFGSGEERPEL